MAGQMLSMESIPARLRRWGLPLFTMDVCHTNCFNRYCLALPPVQAPAGNEDARPQHYVEISKAGDTWLFNKDGAWAAGSCIFPTLAFGSLMSIQASNIPLDGAQLYDTACASLALALFRWQAKVPVAKGCSCNEML